MRTSRIWYREQSDMIHIRGFLARRVAMPTPFAPHIILSHKARTELQALVRASSTPQSLGLRARIVLRAADTDSPTNLRIGHDLVERFVSPFPVKRLVAGQVEVHRAAVQIVWDAG